MVKTLISAIKLWAERTFAKKSELPTKTSDLTNDSNYITKAISDLENYYTKSDSYTKSEVNTLISEIPKFSISVVSALPTSDISDTTIYLVKTSDTESGNLYTEYIYINSTWEKLGEQKVDLTNVIYYDDSEEDPDVDEVVLYSEYEAAINQKQDKLVAGSGITISSDGKTISSTGGSGSGGVIYTAGDNITISTDNTISATDTKYSAGENITISDDNIISATVTDVYNIEQLEYDETTKDAKLTIFTSTSSSIDDHINELIDAKMGVIENGTY